MQEIYLSDNSGNRTPGHPNFYDPAAAGGITQATGTAGDDLEVTLVGGQMYAVIPIDTNVLASITGVTSIEANREWIWLKNQVSIFRMPLGSTVLYCEGDASSKNIYFSKLKG
jgi:hypothetical protein